MLAAITALVLAQGPGTPAPVVKQVSVKVSFLTSAEKMDWSNVPGKASVIKDAAPKLPQRTVLFTGTPRDFLMNPYGTGFHKPGGGGEEKPFLMTISSPILRALVGMPATVIQSYGDPESVAIKVTAWQNKENPFLFDVAVGFDPVKREVADTRPFPFEQKFTVSQNQTIVLGFLPAADDKQMRTRPQAIALAIGEIQ